MLRRFRRRCRWLLLTWLIQSRAGQVDGRRLWTTVVKVEHRDRCDVGRCLAAMWLCGGSNGIPSRLLGWACRSWRR